MSSLRQIEGDKNKRTVSESGKKTSLISAELIEETYHW